MLLRSKTVFLAILSLATVLPAFAHAEGIDTEHLFGFMIGSDVGTAGEREFQSQTGGGFSKGSGSYRKVSQQFELEFVPAPNFRVELGSAFAAHQIDAVGGADDRHQLTWQGASVDLRYRLLERDAAPFGMTVAWENHADRIDEMSGARAQRFGTGLTLAFDRDLIQDRLLAALNLVYEPEWTRFAGSGLAERESTIGAAAALMAQIRPGVLIGGEARYLQKYEGVGLNDLAGKALYIGPTAYFKLSERSRLTAAWSFQAWGHPAGTSAPLDLVNFERHQARLTYGVNF
jgi:hypothetical protein